MRISPGNDRAVVLAVGWVLRRGADGKPCQLVASVRELGQPRPGAILYSFVARAWSAAKDDVAGAGGLRPARRIQATQLIPSRAAL